MNNVLRIHHMKYQSNSSKHLIPIVVGVTGHRDLREEDIPELEKKVEAIFKEIEHKYKDKYQHVPIKILSPLAEGADRLLARVGLHAGHTDVKLTSILPMPKEEYEKDFDTAKSKREFADLLEKAEDVFELPFIEGNTLEMVQRCKESRNNQYALAGIYIAAHSQILIALWDGRATSETAERDIMKNCKDEDKLKKSISYVMPESEQEKLSPGLRKILSCYGYADTLALHYQKITTDVLKRLLITAVASFFFFDIFDQFWAKAYILALFPIIMGMGYLFYKIALRKDYENKYYDYRALAEGLRVQFFWKLMHSKENTYDHYLRKYRGEMDWIFQTIRNVCMNANQEISQNPSACKKGELEIIQRRWVKDQENFFVKKATEKGQKIGRQETTTLCFFCAALVMVLGFFIVKAIVSYQQGSFKDFINMEDIHQGFVCYLFSFLIDVFLAIGAALAIYVEKRAFADELRQYQRMMVLYCRASRFMEKYIAENNIMGAENLAIELGKEALIENGDWYIIQRSKPLEPFLG